MYSRKRTCTVLKKTRARYGEANEKFKKVAQTYCAYFAKLNT